MYRLLLAMAAALTACGAPLAATPPPASGAAHSSSEEAPGGEVAIAIPSCGEAGDCAQGFTVDDRYYFISCTTLRPEAIDEFAFAAGAGEFREVRRITGLPAELFLAVAGDILCSPGGPWWLAQTTDAVEELTPDLRNSLRKALRP